MQKQVRPPRETETQQWPTRQIQQSLGAQPRAWLWRCVRPIFHHHMARPTDNRVLYSMYAVRVVIGLLRLQIVLTTSAFIGTAGVA